MATGTAANRKGPASKFIERRKQPITLKTLKPRWKQALQELGRERVIEMYRQMVLIRSFEQRCEQMYQQRKIGGFLHLYMGEEAVGVGTIAAIGKP